MAVKNDGLCMTYTINRLSETAKTFRRLGEAYECASGDEAQSPSFKRQLFLVADILEDCTLMQLQADKPSKGIARDMASRALVAGIVIKDVNILKDKTGRSEVVILARTLGKGCVAERKIRKIVCDVMGIDTIQTIITGLSLTTTASSMCFIRRTVSDFYQELQENVKKKAALMAIILWYQACRVVKLWRQLQMAVEVARGHLLRAEWL